MRQVLPRRTHVEGTVEEIHEGIIALAREGYAKEVPEITGAAAF